MFVADKFVTEMLWQQKELKTQGVKTIYIIPSCISRISTKIVGEWFEKNDEMFFLVHSWDNSYRGHERRENV